jgi:hypothetical protein
MKIASYTMTLASQHELATSYTKTENFQMWRGFPQNSSDVSPEVSLKSPKDRILISDQAKAANQADSTDALQDGFELSEQDKQKISLIEKILSALAGKKIKLNIPVKLDIHPHPAAGIEINITMAQPQAIPVKGWGISYSSHETYQESEMMNFSARGIVRTADGKEINFSTKLQLSRQFTSREDISIQAGNALKDPLVINFDGVSAMLRSNEVDFDLDGDGDKDNFAFVNPGSGFLAIDKNNNGRIDDGAELFGPSTGNGFAELAKYDEDHNGWIDENDPVYAKLRIWTYDGVVDRLSTLKEKNVGAISVDSIGTEFQYKNSQNQLEGLARSAGVFLKEDGGVGTVQQIDLVV